MRFFLDCTTSGYVAIAVRDRSRQEIRIFPTGDRKRAIVLKEMQRLFSKSHRAIRPWDEVVVVAGPGKFSDLRVAATMANVLAFACGCRISSVHRSNIPPERGGEYLRDLEQRRHKVRRLSPYYGRPPSITSPKKR
ncbi:MAG: hypothetical protein V1778_03690 [bacterium]